MIKLYHCVVCDTKVHTECGSCGTKKPTDQFTEIESLWSNGSKMKIGLCVPCSLKNVHATPEGKEAITQAHFKHWDEMGFVYDKEIVIV